MNPSNRFVERRHCWPTTLVLTTLLLLILAGSQSYAQFLRAVDTTKPPLKPLYGVGNDEFYLSGYFQKWTQFSEQSGNIGWYDDLWNHAHYMRIPILHIAVPSDAGGRASFHRFYNHNSKQAGDRVSLLFGDAFRNGWGQAIELYPFDSVQSSIWPSKFLHRQGGDTAVNYNQPVPGGAFVQEEIYTTSNTGSNDSILWGTVYGYNPSKQVYRYAPYSMPLYHFEDSVQNSESILRPNHPVGPDTLPYLVVTGHLRDIQVQNPNVGNDSALLRIDIIYELPKYRGPYGQPTLYYNDTLGRRVVQNDTEMVCRSFFVRKGDLQPAAGQQWNNYREAAFEMNLQWCSDMRTPGPNTLLKDSAYDVSRRFDIRVHWLGVDEDVYLRSISVRDSVGQLVLGQQQRCITWRNTTLMRGLKEIFYGPNQNFNNGISTYAANTFRPDIIALQSGEEQHSSEYGVYAAMQKMVADSFNLLPLKSAATMQSGDSVRFFEVLHFFR